MDNIADLLSFRLENIVLPQKYSELWNNINYPIQVKKASNYRLPENEKEKILDKLSKRAYFLSTIAKHFGAKNILEVGTAEGWQFFSFAEYCKSVGGKVWSCDIDDRRHEKYIQEYEGVANFCLGDSKKLAEQLNSENIKIDLFYIDGSHDKNAVLKDIANLKSVQTHDSLPVWIFDDYDDRFGCYHDISTVLKSSPSYFVYSPGKTASGNPTHQAIIRGLFK
jgi:predicted O-methyltransferase YrrM